jgi:hypothetical protein
MNFTACFLIFISMNRRTHVFVRTGHRTHEETVFRELELQFFATFPGLIHIVSTLPSLTTLATLRRSLPTRRYGPRTYLAAWS